MLVAETARSINSANLGAQSSFKIAQNSHAFHILSDGLYSDRIKAICRELSTNSIDSHKAARNTNPFEIKLPNYIDPTFYVKDFGTGLSRDQVMNLFSTYFQSDKAHNNDLTGGFGLGSKSPFSYTDSFSVVSRFNNEKTTYNAYISEDGCPQIVVMCSEPSDEPNGVEISFPVKSNDYNEFSNKLADLIPYFDIKPKVIGVDRFKPTEVVYTQKGENWGLRASDYYIRNNNAKVIMGGVAYPINREAFDNSENKDLYNCLIRSQIDIFLNIGDVAINPSREALNYRKPDIEKLEKIFDVIIEDISKITKDRVMTHTTVWGAVVELDKMYEDTPDLRNLIELNQFKINETEIRYRWSQKITIPTTAEIECHNCGYDRKRTFFHPNNQMDVRPTQKSIIIYNDLARGGVGRVFHYRESDMGSKKSIIFIKPETVKVDPTDESSATKKLSVKEASQMFFDAPIILTSSLPEAPRLKNKLSPTGDKRTYNYLEHVIEKTNRFNNYSDIEVKSYSKDDIKERISQYVKEGTEIVIIRTPEVVKNNTGYFKFIERPFAVVKLSYVGVTDTLKAANQLARHIDFPKTVFITVKDKGIVHNYINSLTKTITYDDWCTHSFLPIITKDLTNNLNNLFVSENEYAELHKASTIISRTVVFVKEYTKMKECAELKISNPLLDKMEKLLSTIEDKEGNISEIMSLINKLLNAKIINYTPSTTRRDNFIQLSTKLTSYPMITSILSIVDRFSNYTIESSILSTQEFMTNCVEYMNIMSKKNLT